MAFDAAPFTLSVTFVDKNSNESNKIFELRSADHAAALTDAAAVVAAYGAATKAEILRYAIGTNFIEGTVVMPTSDMPISTVVSVTTALTTPGKKANYAIPMPADVIMSGNNLIASHATAQAVQGLYLAGGEVFISDGEDASGASALEGKLVTRNRTL